MAKITELTLLDTVPATDDWSAVVDVSDTTDNASGTTKRVTRQNYLGYKEYVALLTQTGTNAPTATVVKNDTGATVTWARTTNGVYSATFSSAVLTANKCVVIPPKDNYLALVTAYIFSTTVVPMLTTNLSGTPLDGQLSNSPVIIRIYV